MRIVFFHRKSIGNQVSIEENFKPIINYLAKENEVQVLTVPYAGANPIVLIKNILYIRKHSIKNGINHITGDINYGVIGLIGRPSVVTIHDDYPVRQAQKGLFDKIYKWLFWIYLPIRYSNAPICTTPSTFENIKHHYSSSKLRVITHQTVPSILTDNHKPINKQCPRFLQVGTQQNKNLETTLKALKGLECKLVILKEMSKEQIELAHKMGINYENRWNLPYEEVVKEYQQCDMVLFPSLYEGLGVPIFEGQAAGKPVITTNKDPMKWVAGDGAVLLNNPLDVNEYRAAIEKILFDDDYRKCLIEKGKENSRRFSLNNAVKDYLDLYDKVLHKKVWEEDVNKKTICRGRLSENSDVTI